MLEFDLERLRRRKPEPAKPLHMFPGWNLIRHYAPRLLPDDKDLTWCKGDTIELHPQCFDMYHRFDLKILWVDAFDGWGLFWGDANGQANNRGWNFGLAWSACTCVRGTNMHEAYSLAHTKITKLEALGFRADSFVNLGIAAESYNWHDLVRTAEHAILHFLSNLEHYEDTWWDDDVNKRELRDGLLGENWNKHTDSSTTSAIIKRLGDIWRQPHNENRG